MGLLLFYFTAMKHLLVDWKFNQHATKSYIISLLYASRSHVSIFGEACCTRIRRPNVFHVSRNDGVKMQEFQQKITNMIEWRIVKRLI